MAYATINDYKARYGTPESEERAEVLLADASSYLDSAYFARYHEEHEAGVHPTFDANACAVCCAMVARMLASSADMFGVSQYSQTAGSYTASATFSNPTGDMYVTKSDKQRLGLLGGRMRTIQAATAADRG